MSSIIDSECSEQFCVHAHTHKRAHTNTRAPTDSYPADRPANRQAFCTRSDSLSWLIACDRGLCHNYPGPYHKLMRCIFHVLAAGSAFTVRAGSQSTEKTDLRQIHTHTHMHAQTPVLTGRDGWKQGEGPRKREGKKIKKEGRGRWGESKMWGGAGRQAGRQEGGGR